MEGATSDLEIVAAAEADKPLLFRLLQLYQHDSSEFDDVRCDSSGLFPYPYFDLYWQEPDRYPFLFRHRGQVIGFALINAYSDLGNTGIRAIAEFFVLRSHQNKGIGRQASLKLLDMFPGRWEISQTYGNLPAQRFWENLVRSLVGENFVKHDLPEVRKIVLSFTTC
ncbi:MAG: GNAT family N-acetyltransferase [Luteolibacter sp.]